MRQRVREKDPGRKIGDLKKATWKKKEKQKRDLNQ